MTDHQKLKSLRRFIVTDDKYFPGKKKLKIKGRDLQELAKEIFYITELQVLDLSPERESCLEYQMEECPEEVGKLINLQVLMLDTNELFAIPSSIIRLIKLERLFISNNHIKSLPHGFSRLVNLTSLHLANNKFTEFPMDICELLNLEFVDISDNEVDRLPSDIARLQNLHTLIIFDNKLESLPDSITDMRSLRCLWIGNNNITKLPRNFGVLTLTDWDNFGRHMYSTIVDGNPLVEPPMEICKQGLRAIAQYFNGEYDHNKPPAHLQNSVNGKATSVYCNTQYGSTAALRPPQTVYGGASSRPKAPVDRAGYSTPGRTGSYTERSNGVRAAHSQNTTPKYKYK